MTDYSIEDEILSLVEETKVIYNLEERTFQFAVAVRNFIKKTPKTLTNIEYCRQLARSSSSVGANYIEANESLSTKDFYYRIKVCKKESKESQFFLRLVDIESDQQLMFEQSALIKESHEFVLIFSAILKKQDKSEQKS
ncbi:MAG TPA: four helix bundle protein [Bacteroidia bacterium]|nr:four helix bundle protein [Bacteroidia bacterium]